MNLPLQVIVGRFGLSAKHFVKVESAVLSEVYILDNAYVLRGRKLSDDAIEKVQKEQDLVAVVRPLISTALPQLLAAVTGERFYIHEDILWTAYPLIKGEVLCNWWELEKLSEAEEEVTFTTLAKIHSSTKGKLSTIEIKHEYRFLAEIQQKLLNLKDEISPAQYMRLAKALERTERAENMLTEKELVFVHGDYHPGNFVYKDAQIVGLLDLDWSRKGYQLEDLAYTLVTFLRDCRKTLFEFNEEKFSRYVAWYGLPKEYIALLKEYMLLYALYDFHGFINLSLSAVNQEQLKSLQKSMLSNMCETF